MISEASAVPCAIPFKFLRFPLYGPKRFVSPRAPVTLTAAHTDPFLNNCCSIDMTIVDHLEYSNHDEPSTHCSLSRCKQSAGVVPATVTALHTGMDRTHGSVDKTVVGHLGDRDCSTASMRSFNFHIIRDDVISVALATITAAHRLPFHGNQRPSRILTLQCNLTLDCYLGDALKVASQFPLGYKNDALGALESKSPVDFHDFIPKQALEYALHTLNQHVPDFHPQWCSSFPPLVDVVPYSGYLSRGLHSSSPSTLHLMALLLESYAGLLGK
jgi:hypothetical protein